MEMSLWVAIALLLLSELCQSQLETGCNIEATLNRRQSPIFRPKFPQYTYRGETGRTPEDVRKADRFYSRGLQKQVAGAILTEQELRDGISLFKHAEGYTTQYTRYVSTSSDPAAALKFAVPMGDEADQKGFLYNIHADSRMVDVDRSLGRHSPYLVFGQKEHAAIRYIPFAQIEGWWEITVNLDDQSFDGGKFLHKTGKKLQQARLKNFHKNSKFDESTFAKLRGHGAAPELAGFPPGYRAWREDTWNKFEKQPVENTLDDVISSICASKNKLVKRDTMRCLWQFGYRESVKANKPKILKKLSTPEVPGSAKGAHSSRKESLQTKERRPVRKFPKIRITKIRASNVAAFDLLAPYARDLLEAVKQWDHPVGRAESLFGKHVSEIYGNETKLKILCWLRGEQNDVERGVGSACQRLRQQEEQEKQQDNRIKGLNRLSELCYMIGKSPPEDENVRRRLEECCAAFQVLLEKEEKPHGPT